MSEISRARLWQGRRAGIWTSSTPLEHWSRFERTVGQTVWAKRDDISGLGLGGNKLRKLDLILGSALDAGADTIITTGAVQSNHCRQTAAAASRLGLNAILFLRGSPPATESGNLLADLLFGAEVMFTGDVPQSEANERMIAHASAIKRDGGAPYIIPIGVASVEGCIAYVEACQELAAQCEASEIEPTTIVVTVGKGSTFAGLVLGAEQFMPTTRVIVISVGDPASAVKLEAIAWVQEAAHLLGMVSKLTEDDLDVRMDYVGSAYGAVTDGGRAALHALARSEGVLVDLTYTSKALHALIDLGSRSEIRGPLVFWHTGGFPELFSRPPSDVLG